MRPQDRFDTHEVTNQPGPPPLRDTWAEDVALREAIEAAGGQARPLAEYGAALARPDLAEAARAAEANPPQHLAFDRAGRRLDEVRFDPGYHVLMQTGLAAGYAALPWEGSPGGHATHAAMVYMASQREPGHCCPMTMTYAAIPALAGATGPVAAFRDKTMSRVYDPSVAPIADKSGATIGMAMTEKQGGSDVRANATRAGKADGVWRLTGHKWFCSAPMSDAFLTLAQTEAGLSCFLVPRWLEDGRNGIVIERLKAKLGNRANASAEITYHGAVAYLLGEDGQGVRTILAMVHHTRLDTAMAPAGLMQAALIEAHHWCAGRRTFQKRLIDQPLMRAVLADLALDREGALALGMRVAQAFDDPDQAAFARIGVALAKFLSNKRCPVVVAEAMEVLGGMGYVDETPLPMLYREAPLNGIWEGSGNVICLDILRTLARVPEAGEALRAELAKARGENRHYDAALAGFAARWPGLPPEAEARWFCEQAATLLTASVLLRRAPVALSDAYSATRLGGEGGRISGAMAAREVDVMLDRLAPG
ncbi:acyl-CoA dehydrogenase family protein [Citreimonas sp.]|uniref:acyl-CoA dehydrogenase family protein n=1 Tax=Citreimonas sp. TaxID=3036715 RepID=UPI004058934E